MSAIGTYSKSKMHQNQYYTGYKNVSKLLDVEL